MDLIDLLWNISFLSFRCRTPFFGSTQSCWLPKGLELVLSRVHVAADYSDSMPDSSRYVDNRGYHPLEELKVLEKKKDMMLTDAEIARTTVEVIIYLFQRQIIFTCRMSICLAASIFCEMKDDSCFDLTIDFLLILLLRENSHCISSTFFFLGRAKDDYWTCIVVLYVLKLVKFNNCVQKKKKTQVGGYPQKDAIRYLVYNDSSTLCICIHRL